MHRRSRSFVCAISASLLACVAAVAPAQTTSPRTQLPLNVDRDPVPSPDPETGASGTEQQAPVAVGVGPVGKDASGRYTLERDAYEVRLNASVLDGSGRVVEGLNKDAFHVYEDGVPQTIVGFRHEDLPVSIGLLIDSSGSMMDKRAAVNQAALDLIKLSNPKDEEFLVDFSAEPFIDQDFTSSIDKLQQGLGYINPAGATALYDAIVASSDYLAKNAKNPKQVIVVVTDGDDDASSSTLEQAIRRIQDLDGPVVYCVGLLFGDDTTRGEKRTAKMVLEQLAAQTGGVAYFPKSLKEVDPVAAEVAADIRSQYTIAYRSTNPPSRGGYRQVRVEAKAKGQGKLDVRTRSGYYPRTAPAAAAAQ